jgi:flagellar hook-length control protein FliK
MSVTIASTPATPAPTQSPAADSSSDAGSGQDFANLLLGQLALSVPQTLVASTLQAGRPAADALPTDAVPADVVPIDATATDAAALLAALGFVTPQASAKTTAPETGRTDSAAPLAALPGAATPGPAIETQGKGEALKAEPLPTGIAVTDDKAAKFAATPALEETVTAKTVSLESPSNGIPALTSNAPGIAHKFPAQFDSSLSLPTPIRDQSWAADFGQKVVWLATNDKQSAQLTLNPPQMGPIEISLNMEKGSASVSFASANAEVRDAIETALPRLREMFASAGIELGQTNVGAESFKQQGGNGEQFQSSARSTADNAILAENTAGSRQAKAFGVHQGNGLVDIFA